MSKQALDAVRVNAFAIEPEKLTIITDENHKLYDPRVTLPIDESLVRNIMTYGVKLPILVRKNGDVIEVVDGRQRVRAAIEANKRLEKAGNLLIKVKVLLEKGSDAELFGTGIMLNEQRQGDDLLTKARKAKRMLDLDQDESKCAGVFGITKVQLGRWLKLLDTDPKVQKAIESGEISAMVAVDLAELSHEKQIEMLEQLRVDAEGGGKKKITVAAAKRAVKASKGRVQHKKPSVRTLQKLFAATEEMDSEDRTLIGWVLGEVSEVDAGMTEILHDIEQREKTEAEKLKADKKAEREAARAERSAESELKKKEKQEARLAAKAERDAKKIAKKQAETEKKAAKKAALAEKREARKQADAEKKAAKKQKVAEKKAAKDAAKLAKREVKEKKKAEKIAKREAQKAEKERKKQEKAQKRDAVKAAMEARKDELLKKTAAKSKR